MQDFETLRQPLLRELAMSRREREREKMPFMVATYIYASSQGQQTHSARTNTFMPARSTAQVTYRALGCARAKHAIYSGRLRLCLQPKGSARTPLGPK